MMVVRTADHEWQLLRNALDERDAANARADHAERRLHHANRLLTIACCGLVGLWLVFMLVLLS